MRIPESALKVLAQRALQYVNAQIDEGVDSDGKRYEYSTKPFARPRGGMIGHSSGAPLKQTVKQLEKQGRLETFRNRNGKLWMLVKGGYKDYREMTGRATDGDFLTFTGKLRASMFARPHGQGAVMIGFAGQRNADIAFYMNVSGVGRGRKLWKFLGLTPDNQRALLADAVRLLQASPEVLEELKKDFRVV